VFTVRVAAPMYDFALWCRKSLQDADHDLDRVQRSVIVRDLVEGESGLPPEVCAWECEVVRIGKLQPPPCASGKAVDT